MGEWMSNSPSYFKAVLIIEKHRHTVKMCYIALDVVLHDGLLSLKKCFTSYSNQCHQVFFFTSFTHNALIITLLVTSSC